MRFSGFGYFRVIAAANQQFTSIEQAHFFFDVLLATAEIFGVGVSNIGEDSQSGLNNGA